jgi:hypothetical protein
MDSPASSQKSKLLKTILKGLVFSFINNDNLWWHRNKSMGYRSSSSYTSEPPSAQDNALRFAAGELAKLMERCGYIGQKHHHVRSNMWRSFNKSGGSIPQNYDVPFYPGEWKWSKEMFSTTWRYESLAEKSRAQEEEIKRLKEDKNRGEAEDLWNEA